MKARATRKPKYKPPLWKRKLAKRYAQNMTRPERVLWRELSGKPFGVRFYKQKIMCGYILDFWCPSRRLCVECDGPHHAKQRSYDALRDAVLAKNGVHTQRFTADAIMNNTRAVVAIIGHLVLKRKG